MSSQKTLSGVIEVTSCLETLIKPLLSAHSSVKCVVDDGQIRHIKDVSLLLQHLDIEHPVGQIISLVCQNFVQRYGTGGATLLVFISAFMKAAHSLLSQKISTHETIQCLREALNQCIAHTEKMKIPINHLMSQAPRHKYRNTSGQSAKDPNMNAPNHTHGQTPRHTQSQERIPEHVPEHTPRHIHRHVQAHLPGNNPEHLPEYASSHIQGNIEGQSSGLSGQTTARVVSQSAQEGASTESSPKQYTVTSRPTENYSTSDEDFKPCIGHPKQDKKEDEDDEEDGFKVVQIKKAVVADLCEDVPDEEISAVHLKMKLKTNTQHEDEEGDDNIGWFFEGLPGLDALGIDEQGNLLESTGEGPWEDSDFSNLTVRRSSKLGDRQDKKISVLNKSACDIDQSGPLTTGRLPSCESDDEFDDCFEDTMSQNDKPTMEEKTMDETRVEGNGLNICGKYTDKQDMNLTYTTKEEEEEEEDEFSSCFDSVPSTQKLTRTSHTKKTSSSEDGVMSELKHIDMLLTGLKKSRNTLDKKDIEVNSRHFKDIQACVPSPPSTAQHNIDVINNKSRPQSGSEDSVKRLDDLLKDLHVKTGKPKPCQSTKVLNVSRHFKTVQSTVEHSSQVKSGFEGQDPFLSVTDSVLEPTQTDAQTQSRDRYIPVTDRCITLPSEDSIQEVVISHTDRVNIKGTHLNPDCLTVQSENCSTLRVSQDAKQSESQSLNTSISENHSTENHSTENHSTENHSTENKTTENKTTENHSTENRTKENQSTENHSTENRTKENQSTENETTQNQSTQNLSTETFCSTMPDVSVLQHFVKSLLYNTDKAIVQVITDLIMSQSAVSMDTDIRLSSDCVHCCPVVSMSTQGPKLVEGLVLDVSADMMTIVSDQPGPCRTLLLNGSITQQFHHKGYKKMEGVTTVTSAQQFLAKNHLTKVEQWVADIKQILKELEVKVILASGDICNEIIDLCQFIGVVAIDNIPYRALHVLSVAMETDMVTYITDAMKINVCRVLRLSPWQLNWMDTELKGPIKQKVILSVPGCDIYTVLLQGMTLTIADLMEQEFWECLHRVTSSVKAKAVVPGALHVEQTCSRFCWESADLLKTHGGKQTIDNAMLIAAFEALEKVFQQFTLASQVNSQLFTNTCTSVSEKDLSSDGTLGYVSSGLHYDLSGPCRDKVCRDSTNIELTISSPIAVKLETSVNSCNDDLPLPHGQSHSSINGAVSTPPFSLFEFHVLDDHVTKVAAWQTAFDTAAIILQTDLYVSTGLDRSSAHRHSVLL